MEILSTFYKIYMNNNKVHSLFFCRFLCSLTDRYVRQMAYSRLKQLLLIRREWLQIGLMVYAYAATDVSKL